MDLLILDYNVFILNYIYKDGMRIALWTVAHVSMSESNFYAEFYIFKNAAKE